MPEFPKYFGMVFAVGDRRKLFAGKGLRRAGPGSRLDHYRRHKYQDRNSDQIPE